ncbi:MAG: DUF3306 domain-containing protein [Betaproteobacteria bacterium]|nr:MAG: DUF3306 domain-containing protein [Betaproteobacteria bacterium]
MGGRIRRTELPPRAEEADQAAFVHASEGPRRAVSDEPERFLTRWSRRKTQAREAPRAAPPEAAPPAPAAGETDAPAPLPSVEELTPESDFRPFMDPRVDASTRRAALKHLFADARFNVPDPYEAYSEDYTVGEAIPAEMLKSLNQARKLLFDEPEGAAQTAAEAQPEVPTDSKDVAGRQDA